MSFAITSNRRPMPFSVPRETAAAADTAAAVSPAQSNADTLLVQQAASGNVRAFGQLVERYQRPMAALVSRMTENADDVDDIVQELFVRAWKGLPRFRGDAQFSTWLYRIAVNTTIKHRSRRRNEHAISLSAEDMAGGLESLHAPEGTCDPLLLAQRKEQEAVVRKAVLALPPKQRAVVVLHYFEGHSCDEISQIVGCSVGTVWSRLHYACKRLRGTLGALEGL